VIDEAEVIYWGVCPECQKSAGPRGAPALTHTRTREESRVRRG